MFSLCPVLRSRSAGVLQERAVLSARRHVRALPGQLPGSRHGQRHLRGERAARGQHRIVHHGGLDGAGEYTASSRRIPAVFGSVGEVQIDPEASYVPRGVVHTKADVFEVHLGGRWYEGTEFGHTGVCLEPDTSVS